jgi:hypothetical protein
VGCIASRGGQIKLGGQLAQYGCDERVIRTTAQEERLQSGSGIILSIA